MILCLWILFGFLTLAMMYLILFMNEQDVRRHITVVVGKDRPLKNRHFLGVVAVLVLLERVIFKTIRLPLAWMLVILCLSVYVPLTFFFYCNVFA